jgi:hemerythrin-like domain-containing protein
MALLPATRAGRAARLATALPDDGFEILDATHRAVVEQLGLLAQLIEHLDGAGVDAHASALARRIVDFFDHHARAHHAEEERQVFPALLADGPPELVQQVRRLQQDHGWLEEDWLALSPQLGLVAAGYNGYDLDLLRAALPVYAALYREHIELEESLIYPEARRRRALAQAGVQARQA